ncbi:MULTISPECIES: hypothetical protein [Acinetobacter]|uniref:hypothetical protein n=1 Tax=Acinetobacter TaxID=469 RepID=UPI00070ECDB5|nr:MULTISPECIES: hypothetical protein [Acinetobacter]KRJ19290.1 hypothetical protein APC78_15645 [Acinetobacter pittii]MCM1962767.1 hypothetical protein [Acinetobacter pittii]MCM1979043.1 hypothetical protein [Acinetobacter pittii]MCU4344106.1 hypothetical protein [Acinetobacter pittii]MCU4354671.1 hypothetical protein [Acinetobacter pittii]
MASLYVENSDKWKLLADIDYFTHFVKAWIPFNSWYRTYYPNLKTDREAINEIKTTSNSVQRRFLSLIGGTSEESGQFKSNLAHLHHCLQNTVISNSQQRLTFESFIFEFDRSGLTQHFSERGINYFVQLTATRIDITNVVATVKNASRVTLFNYTHSIYDLSHFRTNLLTSRLSANQKANIENSFNQANPSKPICLLTTDINNCIDIGQYHFINNELIIFKCVIEILYSLRNVLFHGEIIPNKETNKVYEPAYKVLRMLIEPL